MPIDRQRPRRVPASAAIAPEALAAWFVEHGHPAYRARQVLDAAWKGRETAFADILTLPAALRDDLEPRSASIRPPTARSARPTAG